MGKDKWKDKYVMGKDKWKDKWKDKYVMGGKKSENKKILKLWIKKPKG